MKWPASTTGSGNADCSQSSLSSGVGVTPEKTSIAPSITAKADRTSGTSATVPRVSAAFAAGRASESR